MSQCPGRRTTTNSQCAVMLYRCKKCGNVGCDQPRENHCSNQGFKNQRCESCGAYNQKEPVR